MTSRISLCKFHRSNDKQKAAAQATDFLLQLTDKKQAEKIVS